MNKKLIIKQEEISDCGVCSLLSIIRYYGGNASLEELRVSSRTTKEGVSLFNLSNCAKEYGFDSEAYKLKRIPVDKLPCIAHVIINQSLSHFMVIYEVKKDKVVVMDPAHGYREIPIDDYYKMSTNKYILLNSINVYKSYNPQSFIKNINSSFIKKCKPLISIYLLNILYLILSLLFSFYIVILKECQNLYIILLFLIIIIIINYLNYLINNNINKLNNSISSELIKKFLIHIFNLPLKYIHMKDSGEIVKRVQDLDSIKDINTSFIISVLTNTLIIISVSIIILCLDSCLLIFILITIIGYLLLVYITNHNINNKVNEVIDNDLEYNSLLIDSIQGIISVKHNQSEDYFVNNIINKYNNSINTKYYYNKYISRIDFFKQSFISMIEFIINAYLLFKIFYSNSTFEVFIIINTLFQLLSSSIQSIGNYIPMLLYQNKIITKIDEFYNINEESKNYKRISMNKLSINNLEFSYDKYNNNLKNINLSLNKNDKLIIKGNSGSGKSTLCKLLNKEYDDYNGNIIINNDNYKDLDVLSIRNIISYSSQNEKLFYGTIKDNILLGHKISDKRLNMIIDVCELNEVLSKKPYGINTYLYGGGSELSGGERQLIILARSLVMNKDLIILDETLSEVNDRIEDKVLYNLFNNYDNKTIIYVSHKNKKNYFKRTLYV